jgi:hypothetical protein
MLVPRTPTEFSKEGVKIEENLLAAVSGHRSPCDGLLLTEQRDLALRREREVFVESVQLPDARG